MPGHTLRLVITLAVASAAVGCGDEFVSESIYARVDCAFCAYVAERTENCGLLETGTTEADYEATCRNAVSHLCDSDPQNFLEQSERCLTETSCSEFSDCYWLQLSTFNDRTHCTAICEE